MSGELFNDLVKLIESSISIKDPKRLVEEQCKSIGKNPDELSHDDSSFLVLSIMTNLGDSISKDEWEKLDEGFKELLSEDNVIKGKVRGGLIKGVMQYYSFKKGQKGLEILESRAHASSKFRNDSWYPASILGDLLTIIDELYDAEYSKSREIGEYIILNNHIFPIYHWFGKGDCEPESILLNLQELMLLEDFKVESNNGVCSFSFRGAGSDNFQQFLVGICCGIKKLQECSGNSIKVIEEDNGILVYQLSFGDRQAEPRGWA